MNKLRQLGISIYPSNQDTKEMKAYIEKAAKLGYSRIFASMLEVSEETKDEVLAKFKDVFGYAKERGFDICLDVSPRIFDLLDIKFDDLSLFNELNATTLRLDEPFNGKAEAEMTFNNLGINIEVNMSSGTKYIENILTYKPNKDKLIACHNFYPQRGAGLDYEFFLETSRATKELGIRTAAFVASKHGESGPWNVTDGLPTIEMHRDLPISTQAKHLWATGLIDDVIIGNAFASDKELEDLTKINRYKINLSVNLSKNTTKLEEEIIKLDNHFRRGDINSSSIRSTMSRVVYKKEKFPIHDNSSKQNKGDIFIGNDSFGIYKGELQLILNDLPVDERKNKVATVIKDELFLIDFIKSWDKFEFIVEGKNEK